MSPFHYAEHAARLIRAARARIRPHRPAPPAYAIAAIAEAIRGAGSRQHRRQLATAVGVGAAILGAVGVLSVAPGRSRRTVAVAPPPPLASAPRARLVAGPNLPASLASPGGLTLHVAKLQPGQRFVVLTPDAEVEVRGTRFRVALVAPNESCGQGTPTRVAVDEGVVVVRSTAAEVRVPAGQRWPAICPPPQAPVPPTPPVVTTRIRKTARTTSDSTLATENDLFGAALRAEHFGDRVEAANLLDALLTRFPQSPLRESAQRALVAATTASP